MLGTLVLGPFAETKGTRRTGAKARIKSEVGHAHPTKLLLGNANVSNAVPCKELCVLTVLYLAFILVHMDVIT